MEGGYHKLDVYKLAHGLAIRVHTMTLSLPKFEMYEEGSQLRRSSKSVSSNIVEGYALRKYKNEYLHHLYRAYGSSEETLEHLSFLSKTQCLTDDTLYRELSEAYKQLNRMLFRFIESVEQTHTAPGYLKDPLADYEPDAKPTSESLDTRES